MTAQPCKCCNSANPGDTRLVRGIVYNRLDETARDWANTNGMARAEFCVRVNGGKQFSGPEWIRKKCGDGRMGFTTRRRHRDDVRIEIGMDGQFKANRHTVVRSKSAKAIASRRPRRIDGSKFCLVSSVDIALASQDHTEIKEKRTSAKKLARAKTRNNRARRGHKRHISILS